MTKIPTNWYPSTTTTTNAGVVRTIIGGVQRITIGGTPRQLASNVFTPKIPTVWT